MAEHRTNHDNRSRAWLLVGLVLFAAGACWWLKRWKNEADAQQVQSHKDAYRQARIDRLEANGSTDGGFDYVPAQAAKD
mgnify:FL=1